MNESDKLDYLPRLLEIEQTKRLNRKFWALSVFIVAFLLGILITISN